jgi:cell division protein FtsL
MSISTLMEVAFPIFAGIHVDHPALLERLKYFADAYPLSTIAINASVEFVRFGIIPFSGSGIGDALELKMFLNANELSFVEQRKDRSSALCDAARVDKIVRSNLAEQNIDPGQIFVDQAWSRNRNFDMIFVSPATLLLAIVHSSVQSPGLKKYAGLIHALLAVVADEHSAVLKQFIECQHTNGKRYPEPTFDMTVPVISKKRTRSYTIIALIMVVVFVCAFGMAWIAPHAHTRSMDQMLCRHLQIPSNDAQLTIWPPMENDNHMRNGILSLMEYSPSVIICAVVSSVNHTLWQSRASLVLSAIQKVGIQFIQ